MAKLYVWCEVTQAYRPLCPFPRGSRLATIWAMIRAGETGRLFSSLLDQLRAGAVQSRFTYS